MWHLIYQQTVKQSRLLKCGITWNLTREKNKRILKDSWRGRQENSVVSFSIDL